MENWRDDPRLFNWRPAILALDQVLREFVGLVQTQPFEGLSPAMRFRLELLINPSEHHQNPEIFLMVDPQEYLMAKGRPGGLESMFKSKIETSVLKDSDGTWRAVAIDQLRWVYDGSLKLWVKEKSVAV
jgi:hypothetical protein